MGALAGGDEEGREGGQGIILQLPSLGCTVGHLLQSQPLPLVPVTGLLLVSSGWGGMIAPHSFQPRVGISPPLKDSFKPVQTF